MELLKNEQLAIDIQAYKDNFESNKNLEIELLLEEKQNLMLQLKEISSFEDIQNKIQEINKIDVAIQNKKKETADSLNATSILLFNGKYYEGRKIVAGRVTNSNRYKFANGDKVTLSYQGIEFGEIFTVLHEEGKNPVVVNNENKVFSPSKLTEVFHTQNLGKTLTENSKGMAGLSHPYWIKVN